MALWHGSQWCFVSSGWCNFPIRQLPSGSEEMLPEGGDLGIPKAAGEAKAPSFPFTTGILWKRNLATAKSVHTWCIDSYPIQKF